MRKYSLDTLLRTTVVTRGLLEDICYRSATQLNKLETLPINRPISILKSLYADTIQSLQSISWNESKGTNVVTNSRLLETTLGSLDARQGMVIETVADAYSKHFHHILPGYLRTQSSLSVLLQHAVGLTSSRHFNATGAVDRNVDLVTLCQDIRNQATMLAEHQTGWSCDVIITTQNQQHSNQPILVTCIPSLVRFAILEVVKNAVGATIERYQQDHQSIFEDIHLDYAELVMKAPVVTILVIDQLSTNDVRIVIQDQGSGMNNNQLNHAFDFLHSSTIKPASLVDAQASYQPMSSPMKGLGVGLCMSKHYITHFGGELMLTSTQKQGTIATIVLPKDTSIEECLVE